MGPHNFFDQLTSLLEGTSLALFSLHEEEAGLKALYIPPLFPIPTSLETTGREVLKELKETEKRELWRLLNFQWNARQSSLQGMLLLALKMSPQQVLLFLRFFQCYLKLDQDRLKEEFQLTSKQCEVLEGFWSSYSNRELAHQMGRSIHTVRSHLRHIFQKMGVSNRMELLWRLFEYCELEGE